MGRWDTKAPPHATHATQPARHARRGATPGPTRCPTDSTLNRHQATIICFTHNQQMCFSSQHPPPAIQHNTTQHSILYCTNTRTSFATHTPHAGTRLNKHQITGDKPHTFRPIPTHNQHNRPRGPLHPAPHQVAPPSPFPQVCYPLAEHLCPHR